MSGVVGVINNVITTVAAQVEAFATAVVAAGAQVLNDFINALAGPAAFDKVISEFSTQNSYLFTDDKYIDNLYNTDRIALNSLIKGTSFTNEIIDFYRKTSLSTNYTNDTAVENTFNLYVAGQTHQVSNYYTVWSPDIRSNYSISGHPGAGNDLDEILPSVTLRVNNLNLYAGKVPAQCASTGGRQASFKWHAVLEDDNGMQGAEGYYLYAPTLNSTTFASVQQHTKNYVKALGLPDPENLLDDLPYSAHSNIIDSAFINFRVKWVSGSDSTTGNRISNKYLWLLAEKLYNVSSMPHSLTTYTNDDGDETIALFQYQVNGDGHNYTMGISHVTKSIIYTNQNNSPHAYYQYDKNLTSNDGYYYYDANKTLPVGAHSAQTVADVQDYLDASIGTTEVKANWLEIEKNNVSFTVGGVASVFPDEISLVGSGITLYVSSTVTADDQVLRVGNLYIKKSSTEIMFATVPRSVYSNASVLYGKSNATSVIYYGVHNISAVERITDYAGETTVNGVRTNTEFRYITHKLDASNNCVSAPVIWDIYEALDPFEQHKLVMASANISIHLAQYERIEKTWEEKARAATFEVIRIGTIVFAIYSLGSSSSLVVLAENAIVAYATSLAVNVFIEKILVPIVISNFGEDEALIVLAAAAVAIAVYSSKSGKPGVNQFSSQVALFTASVDIMNQMYSIAVVQPGLLEMEKEQEKLLATDNELTEKEEEREYEMNALFGTEGSSSDLLNLQIRAALNPMPASAYVSYHDNILERQFDCFDYEKYNELNVS